MKKIIRLLALLVFVTNISNAGIINSETARQLAEKFCSSTLRSKHLNIQLSQTEANNKGFPLYYVFTVSDEGGFIIIAADDAAHPIIGYSLTGEFSIPDARSNIAIWMQKRKTEIEYIRTNNLHPDADITMEWSGNFNQTNFCKNTNPTLQSVNPLCQTTWNQSPDYNALCPGGSITGCVATAMSQIMRYWSYPATGQGSSSYCDCTSGGFSQNYGTLSANYGATTYNWGNMPNSISGPNNDVATINYHCGVSVNMDYSPSFSGAWVISGDAPICAQNSFVTYFKYDPNTIQGLYRSAYSDNAWIALLENDLTLGQPIQYVGWDPSNGGHTWVCDGFDASNNLHMNWGWGGYANGYYALNNMNPGGYNFSNGHEALIGIKPLSTISVDAGILSIVTPNGTVCNTTFIPKVQLHNYGANTLTSCAIKYHVDNNANQTYNWSGSLASGASVNVTLASMTTTSGAHTFTSFTTNPNSTTDGNATNDQTIGNFTVSTSGLPLPLVQGFESITVMPPTWSLSNPDNDAAWEISTTVGRSSSHCMFFNNCNGDGSTDMTGMKDWVYIRPLSFASITSSSMSFDVAYAPAQYQSTLYTDTLVVFVSTNCGATWTQLYRKGGVSLATAPTYTITQTSACWPDPTSTQWRNEVFTLPTSLNNQSNVIFAFENISDWGEQLYVDNINIYSNTSTGIGSSADDNSMILYPNPASGSVTITGMGHKGKINYSIYDAAGQVVMNGEFNSAGDFTESISLNGISNGIYFVRLNDENNYWMKKLVIQ